MAKRAFTRLEKATLAGLGPLTPDQRARAEQFILDNPMKQIEAIPVTLRPQARQRTANRRERRARAAREGKNA